jgi:hypothetical protein
MGSVAPTLLPPGERRRATMASKLVLRAGIEALGGNGADGRGLFCVFASASGELSIMDGICRTLLEPERPVSPTQFHNSVHNAPAGYWSIATGSGAPSLSLSAFDGSFAAGLLEAAVVADAERRPVLLMAYDLPAPEPLDAARPLTGPFAVALLLQPESGGGRCWELDLQSAAAGDDGTLADPELERLRRGNPAARCLPLLRALAIATEETVRLPAPDATLLVRVIRRDV